MPTSENTPKTETKNKVKTKIEAEATTLDEAPKPQKALKLSKRSFKGSAVKSYLEDRHDFRVARTNGLFNTDAVNSCRKGLKIGEAEAIALLGGAFAIAFDSKNETLSYLYTPEIKD